MIFIRNEIPYGKRNITTNSENGENSSAEYYSEDTEEEVIN